MKPEPWALLEDIAKHLGVSTDTVHRWIRHRQDRRLAHAFAGIHTMTGQAQPFGVNAAVRHGGCVPL